MDKRTSTLDDILARARAEAPVMTREESRQLVREAPAAREIPHSTNWRRIMMIGAILTTAVAIGIWTLTPVQETPSSQRRAALEDGKVERPMSGKTTDQNVVVEEQGTAPLQQSAFKAPAPTMDVGKSRKEVHSIVTRPVNISGVRMIDPPAWLLDSLGVKITDAYVLYHTMYSPNDTVMVFKILRGVVSPLIVHRSDAPRELDRLRWEWLEPRMITNSQGQWIARATFPRDSLQRGNRNSPLHQVHQERDSIAERQQLFSMDRLIPLRVTVNQTEKSYYIFWYDPTAEFLNLLPSQVLIQLRLEAVTSQMALYDTDQDSSARMSDLNRFKSVLDSLIDRRIANGETMPQPTRAHPGAPIMELSRTSDGAISLYSISPNPNRGEFRIHFAVREARTIGFSVYDIHGNRLQVATSGVRLKAEDSESIVRIKKDLPSGMYLLVLSTDRGERAVQRLVIER